VHVVQAVAPVFVLRDLHAADVQRAKVAPRCGGRRWPGCTRWCWWPGWVSAWSPGSRAAGEHQAEGHGIGRASRPTVLQRADAGQELDQGADVAGLGAGACAETRKPDERAAAGPSGSGAGRKFALSYRNLREQVTRLRPPDKCDY
jgi:hypothetical protein